MNRRETLKLLGGTAVAAAASFSSQLAFAAEPTMVVVVKIAGIPWFNALEKGVAKGGADFKINAAMVGPANVDPAQQVKLLEDLIAKKVNVIGLVPLDVKVTAPVLKRAQEAGIKVITHEGPEQEGRDWNVELIDSKQFGEVQMQRLAKDMGEEGDYVVYVGTLTTPLHNKWADAAIAYQKEHYPKMKLVADRFPGADEIDTSYKTTLDVIKAYPNLKGILGFGSNGPIGAGNAVREKRLGKKIAIVGTVLPSQAQGSDRRRDYPRGLPLESDRRRLCDGRGRAACSRRHGNEGRHGDTRPGQGIRRRARQADQGRQDHAHQQ